jgi:hypothetical protein
MATRPYRSLIRWGITVTGIALAVGGARDAWKYWKFLRELEGFPDPGIPGVIRFNFLMDFAGTLVILGLTAWAFFGLKKWAKNIA